MQAEKKKQILRILLFIIIMLFIVSLSPFVVRPLQGTDVYPLVGTIVFFLTFTLLYGTPILFVHWEGNDSAEPLGLDTEDSSMVYDLLIGSISGTIASLFVVIIALFFGGTLRAPTEIGYDLLVSQIIITVPTAVLEELAYRGYLLSRMAQLMNRFMAIVGSSLVFSLLHFSWWVPLGSVPLPLVILFTINIALGGVVLSFGYFRTNKSLWLPIGFHFAWNMVAYIMFPHFPIVHVDMAYIFQIEWGLTTIPGFLIGLAVILIFTKNRNEAEERPSAIDSERDVARLA